MTRVAVIGAGAAGLCAARYLMAKNNVFEPVVFEKADRIGGQWVYTEKTGLDCHGIPIHSSMYRDLKTNIPKELMAFPDFPFDHTLPSYVTHEDVLHYLEQYADNFDLLKYIKFQTIVESVKPVIKNGKTIWEVIISVRDLNNHSNDLHTSLFDGVIVCVGQFSVAKIPKLKGQETFTGTIFQSHDYRTPEEFKDQNVVCIGAGFSGQDIALDLHPQANKVYLSHWHNTLSSEFPANVIQVPPVAYINGNQVVFTNGLTRETDSIILCTGYEYSFPFLSKECHVTIDKEGNKISPLFKHLIHSDFHSLSFIDMPYIVVPFLMFSYQARFVEAVLKGSFKFPPKEQIEAENEIELQRRLDMGWPRRFVHKLGSLQWEYYDKLAELAEVEPIRPVLKSLWDEMFHLMQNDVWHYKKINYEIVDDNKWRQV